jgi:hypothetical protein
MTAKIKKGSLTAILAGYTTLGKIYISPFLQNIPSLAPK